MDDPTQQTFPPFAPQPAPMFDDKKVVDPNSPTPRKRARKPNGTKPSPASAKPAKKGKPRGARRVMPAATVTATPEPAPKQKRARKPRQARAMQVAISVLPALVGLKPDELSALLQFADAIKVFGKKGRARIAAALGKLAG